MIRIRTLALVAAALVLAAGCSTDTSGAAASRSVDPNAVTISAKDLVFSTDALSAPADQPFQIAFDNQEAAPHNVAIYRDPSAAELVFGSEPFSGPAQVTYDVPALAAGTYYFRCDVHPEMAGQVTVS